MENRPAYSSDFDPYKADIELINALTESQKKIEPPKNPFDFATPDQLIELIISLHPSRGKESHRDASVYLDAVVPSLCYLRDCENLRFDAQRLGELISKSALSQLVESNKETLPISMLGKISALITQCDISQSNQVLSEHDKEDFLLVTGMLGESYGKIFSHPCHDFGLAFSSC